MSQCPPILMIFVYLSVLHSLSSAGATNCLPFQLHLLYRPLKLENCTAALLQKIGILYFSGRTPLPLKKGYQSLQSIEKIDSQGSIYEIITSLLKVRTKRYDYIAIDFTR